MGAPRKKTSLRVTSNSILQTTWIQGVNALIQIMTRGQTTTLTSPREWTLQIMPLVLPSPTGNTVMDHQTEVEDSSSTLEIKMKKDYSEAAIPSASDSASTSIT